MTYETLIYTSEEPIATIRLNRPERMNAFTTHMGREIAAAVAQAHDDDGIRAIIFTGTGDRAYCAGADLRAGADTFNADSRQEGNAPEIARDSGGVLTLQLFQSNKPLIAAINGAAVGVGVTMTLPMDIRIASTTARFGFVFARRGLVPEAASSWFLPRIVGISKALEWTYSGRVFNAEEALSGGLVRSLHEPHALLDAAREIALEIAANTAPVSIAMTRHMLWRMLGADHPMAAHRVDSRAMRTLGSGADAAEGVTSFLEKRPPQFTGNVNRDMPDFFPWWDEPEFK